MDIENKILDLEKSLGWTREEAESCGCNFHPDGPCSNCWSLGWGIGGIEVEARSGESTDA
ncbi:hypothetical protein ACEOIM_06115 [Pseudomonas aeruginosa]|uniref:hypothetical protein n=1 Tax=Pseudomonas aeruginosa TaxID=287 RepID=UPI001295E6E3|nr:hypothetical protein [Pseudomonas aeruginosa]MBX5769599.1 hypothetical protein [Pseudomonas aeruginosa]MBY9835031.1 hypothetical protein [Pseudomonas aeruginosa]MDU3632687.1 hypothetical protein [Pseudomonas aeruginosa]UXH58377.1 hypothetical protein N5877_28155 [Pseudomonas aeruginosa]HCF0216069.1 hypothetical protein [Pseudomonas aeruginosa]